MKDLELYLSLAGTSLGLLITIITFILKFIKNTKAKKAAQTLLKIRSAIFPFIEEAETFIHYTGKEKKAYVMTNITQLMINQKMNVNQDKISEIIEDLVSLTKKVNTINTRSPKELQRLYD
ncbi:hypothetical protein KHQ81_08445 [Mycoplasmatota bacterium]|nr:hypothetical protein KHQ81_08445 [Mycoplasmatota bacterium]